MRRKTSLSEHALVKPVHPRLARGGVLLGAPAARASAVDLVNEVRSAAGAHDDLHAALDRGLGELRWRVRADAGGGGSGGGLRSVHVEL